MYKRSGVQSPAYTKNWSVFWSDDKELSSRADFINLKSLSKKKKKKKKQIKEGSVLQGYNDNSMVTYF